MNYLKNYLSTNDKLKRDGIYSFGIPAYKAADGSITCPGALNCIKGCYARTGRYRMPNVIKAQEARLELTKDPEMFIAVLDTEIRKKRVKIVRIHDSGDFYSLEYLKAWFAVMQLNSTVRFYAYTKNIPLFQGLKLPANFTCIFSEGGRFDMLINRDTDRHSRIFSSLRELRAAKYVNTTTHDKNAYMSKSNRIGLVYHGGKAKAWTTNN